MRSSILLPLLTGPAGVIDLTLDLTAIPQPAGPTAVLPGETWTFQCWFRDSNPGGTSNLTSAIQITFE